MQRAVVLIAIVCGCGSATPSNEPADGDLTESATLDSALADSALIDSAVVDTSLLDSAPGDGALEADATACGCTSYTDPVSAGTIANAALNEISGLAASKRNPGVIWTHNDSGDTARLFAIDVKGSFLGEVTVTGATAVDWEDIAVGSCTAGTCIYVGDFGDNAMARDNDALYRIVEPKLDGKPFAKQTVSAEKIPFAYPDGKWNAEALLIHPITGEIVIVTKGLSPGIYRFPAALTADLKVTLTKVGVPAGLDGVVTGGDVSPCGDRALLRTYASLFEYRIGGDLSTGLATMPSKVAVGKEAQGEAVTYRLDGRGYFTASEGSNVALFATDCR